MNLRAHSEKENSVTSVSETSLNGENVGSQSVIPW